MHVTFADFEDRLLPYLPGATRPAARQAFYDAARTFYRRSRSWRVVIGAVTVREGEDTVPVNPVDQDTMVCYVEGYAVPAAGGVQIITTGYNGHASISINGRGHLLSVPNPHTVLIQPPPAETVPNAFWIEVSAQPRPGADKLPEIALTHHSDGLLAGCLAAMLKQPAKPYSNPAQALIEHRRFETEIARAVSNIATSYGQRSVPWRYPTVAMR